MDPFKERIVFLENELKQKDTVIKLLTKKLVEDNCQVVSKEINANVSLVQSNDSDKSSQDKRLSKNRSVKVNNIPGEASDVILHKLDNFLKNKPDGLIVHAGTNNIAKGKNLLNDVKKILKQVKKLSPNIKEAFSSYSN